MDKCLWGCLVQLSARLGPEGMGRLLVALHELAQEHRLLDCELVNRELAAGGLTGLQVDAPTLGLALEALRKAGFVSAEPVKVH